MGIREESMAPVTGYRLINYEMNWPQTLSNSIHTIAGVPANGVIDVSSFSTAGGDQIISMAPRTATVSIVTNTTNGTRTLNATLRGYNSLGRFVESKMTMTATVSGGVAVTVRQETNDIFAFLQSIEIVASTGYQGGDATHVGTFGDFAGNLTHWKTIHWGLPLQLKGSRFDSSAGNEGFRCDRGDLISRFCFYTAGTNVFTLVFETIANLRYDPGKGGFRWINTPTGPTNPSGFSAGQGFKISLLLRAAT